MCVNTKPEPEDEAEEGLGGLPSNISSVSSLLLFNTTENLYGTRRGPGRVAGWPGLVGAPGWVGGTSDSGAEACRLGSPEPSSLIALLRCRRPQYRLTVAWMK